MKRTDIRYLRTEKMIFDALTDLLSEKPYDKITVQDIADRAMINRATFYAHYADKDELYHFIITHILEELSEMIDKAQATTPNSVEVKKAEKMLYSYYNNLKKHSTIAKIVSKSSSREELQHNFARLLHEKYDDLFDKVQVTEAGMPVPTDFIVAYLASIFVRTLLWWIESDFDMDSRDLARLVIKLISNGHLTVMGININRD